MSEMPGKLQVSHLGYRYPDGREALRDVSFDIQPGECVGLIGPNGAGKSTLLLHLNGLLPETFDSHAVLIDGQAISSTNLPWARGQVGLVFQDPNDQLFCPTVGEDVAFGPAQQKLPSEEVVIRVRDALAKVGLDGFEDRLTHHLSVGEKRRVCIAGVLACEPGILVLDEPTSNLDPAGRRELRTLLASLSCTRIIATHDLEMVVELCSRVILIDAGRVVTQGETRSILNDEALMLRHKLERPHILQHQHPHGQVLPRINLST